MTAAEVLQCDYFDAGRCRSCTLLGTSYAEQVRTKQHRCQETLAPLAPGLRWHEPFSSRPSGFRNKAKLVVGGTRAEPTVGILDRAGEGIDLRSCRLYEPGLAEAVQQVPALITELGLRPYAVPQRSGELKYVLLTHSPDGELMARFVLRSPGQLTRIHEGLPLLAQRWPRLRVASVNVQPVHAAVLEGPEEIMLSAPEELAFPLNDVCLRVRPRSFFQTNTGVAAGLYRQARDWITQVDPASLWDLYCGVGGFALHNLLRADGSPRHVLGMELSAEAIDSARRAATDLPGAPRFVTGDVLQQMPPGPAPDLVVVNPPRRGLGPELAHWLESSSVEHVLYSSCHLPSLARDLAAMPSLVPVHARLFDMFPQTQHLEVLTLLRRR